MPNPAAGVFKQVAVKVETTFGTAPGASGAQALRRVQSTVDLQKDTYTSNELRTDFQIADFRHGVRRIGGQLNGELSPGTYARFMEWACKRDFTSGVSVSAVSLTIAGSGPTYTITRAAGSYLTDGFKVGDVVRLSVGSLNAANINKNLVIVDIGSATVITVIPVNGVAMVAEGPITGCTVAVQGKKTYIPLTGHTDKSFALEHWYSDLTQSELFTGCKVSKLSFGLPPTGMATLGIEVMGQNITTAASQYFTSPTAVTTGGVLAAVNGLVRVGGTTVATLTGLSFDIDPNFTGDPVVGSNTVPFLFPGKVNVNGQFTAYFDSITNRDAFINETEIDLLAVLTSDNTATSKFISVYMPRIKLGSANKDDGDKGLVQTFSFQALLNVNGGTGVKTEATTVQVVDSDA